MKNKIQPSKCLHSLSFINFIFLISCIAAHAPANADDMKWYGGAGLRYSDKYFQDGVVDNDAQGKDQSKERTLRYHYKAKLGATGASEKLDWAIGLRTQGSGNTEYIAYNASGTDLGIGLEQGFFRYADDFGFGGISVALGRQKSIFVYDTVVQNLFSNDFRFDGLGWQWKNGNFGLNISQFLLGSATAGTLGTTSVTTTDSTRASGTNPRMNYFFAAQPTYQWKINDDFSSLFAVGYYKFSTEGYSNTAHGFVGTVGTVLPASQGFSVDLDNSEILQLFTKMEMPYKLELNAEWLHNKSITYPQSQTNKLDRDALAVGLVYGKLKVAHDFTARYAYLSKGLGATNTYMSNVLIPSDQKGHLLGIGYSITDKFSIGALGLFLREISRKENTGSAMGSTAGTSTFSTYESKVNYFQITADMVI